MQLRLVVGWTERVSDPDRSAGDADRDLDADADADGDPHADTHRDGDSAHLVDVMSVEPPLRHLGFAQGTAGATYQSVVFTNTGGAPCTLRGYPGVSFVDASGARIGKPSSQAPGKVKTVTLAPSGQASATLKQPDSGAFPRSSCHQKTANRLKVYPPGQKVALFANDTAQVCSTGAGRSEISPVAPGSGA